MNNVNLASSSMLDVRDWIQRKKPYGPATERDYLAQVNRCPRVYNANGLEDISSSLDAFAARFRRNNFPAGFKTPDAYQAWRRKVTAVLKRFHGEFASKAQRSGRQDAWADLLEVCVSLLEMKGGSSMQGLIPIRILADEARKADQQPDQLTEPFLTDLSDALRGTQRRSVGNAIRNLEIMRQNSPALDALLPPGPLPDLARVRRSGQMPLPEHLSVQLDRLVEDLGGGVYDEILDESLEGKSPATLQTYRAALNKYLGSAMRLGLLPPTSDIGDAFTKDVFVSVLRDWIAETDPARKISDRSMRSYVGTLRSAALRLNAPIIPLIDKTLNANRNMRKGFEDAKRMPEHVRQFCSRLVRERRAELTFLSLHTQFRKRALALLNKPGADTYDEERIVQFGMLAAFCAIGLWGVPLRLGNLIRLRHRGENPTLVLPYGSRDRAHILIGAQDVKNRRPIRAQIAQGPTHGLGVLQWYIDEIRPRIPWADRSPFLFPGYSGTLIGQKTLGDWLTNHTRAIGLPMTPHNLRHGLATLHLKYHPGDYGGAARLLCNTPQTVRQYYAWIDEEAEMRNVQQEVAKLGGFSDEL